MGINAAQSFPYNGISVTMEKIAADTMRVVCQMKKNQPHGILA